MILAPKLNWRRQLPLLALVTTVALLLFLALVPVKAAGAPVEACELWRTAGGVNVYRCEDDSTGIVCFSQGLMIFCVTP